LMLYPVQNLTHVITPVLHPILSAHQDDRKYIYEKYLKVLKVLSLLGVFVSAYCYFAAEEIIMILYGEQWYASVPSFQLLALSIWAQMISSSTGSIFQSIGNTKLMFLTGTVSSVLIVGAILVGIGFGNINMVAGFVTLAFNINIAISFYYLIKKGLGYSLRAFAGKFVPDFIIFLITFVGLYFISQISFNHPLISAIIKGIVAVVLFAFGLFITKQYSTVKGIIGRK
ncbi:oligosaccharide flippase family protein, partial [Alkalibaculum bacchi]|uniref:oligosaccharide flippase family protein n=1 Tax=Alkalibaculum bacchi TaxID=645887 RepID=UPI0026F0178A